MRIGFLLPSNFAVGNPGNGVRAQARYQTEALRKLGHDVVCLSPWDDCSAGFDVVQFFQGGFANFSIESTRSSGHKCLVFAPIIDSNESNLRYRIAARLGSTLKKVFTIPAVLQQQARASDLVVCRSRHEQARIVEGLGIDAAKVKIVLNGVTPPDVGGASDGGLTLDLPERFVLHVSAYTQERKNVLRLIEAVGPLAIPLVVAGAGRPGHVMDRLNALAGRYPSVRLLRYVDEPTLRALYRRCKVFCLPSVHEGTGLVALEAAAYGAQVVITQNGGTRDYFADLAFYVDPFDVNTIRGAVATAWATPPSEALRLHVTTNLTWQRSAEALVAVYDDSVVDATAGGSGAFPVRTPLVGGLAE